MSILISDKSALEYWRRHEFGHSSNLGSARTSSVPKRIDFAQIVEIASQVDLSYPFDVLVANRGATIANKIVHSHYCGKPLPRNSVVRIERDLLVSSPEFCFLQCARSYPLELLILLGYEFCGSYRMNRETDNKSISFIDLGGDVPPTPQSLPIKRNSKPYSPSEQGFRSDIRLTSVSKMRAFLEKAVGFCGAKLARRALAHILDDSASPMETRLSMLLTLPYLLGGFGLPHPLMNSKIKVSKRSSKAANKDFYVADLYWPKARLAVEYDSDSFHTGAIQIAEDSQRRNALSFMGIKVIAITRKQLKDVESLRHAVNLISKYLHKRQRYDTSIFMQRHQELRQTLRL